MWGTRRKTVEWRHGLAAPVGDGLGDDGDVGDAGLAESVHDGGETAEGNGFVATEEDGILRLFELFFDAVGELVDIDLIVVEIDELVFVDGDDEALLGDFAHGVSFGYVHFDAGLKDGSGNHEDDEEDEDDVNEGNHVDVGEGGLGGFG